MAYLREEEHVAPPGTPNALADKFYRDVAAPDAQKFSDVTKGIAKNQIDNSYRSP